MITSNIAGMRPLHRDNGTLEWISLCRHKSDWLGQDAHPHPIYSHSGDKIYFKARTDEDVEVFCVEI